jgi:hypothetical protein
VHILVSTIEVSCIQITFLVTDEFSMYLNTFCDKVRWSMLVAMVLCIPIRNTVISKSKYVHLTNL